MSFISQEDAARELEWRKCASDVFYFLETYWYISIPEDSIKLVLRPPQRTAIETWETGQNTLSLKARQIGWSTISAGYAFWKGYFHSDTHVVMLSRTERKAVDLLDMSKYGYDRLPEWMRERGPKSPKNTQLELAFDNGSKLESMPSRKDAARGTTASLVIVDEWAFFPFPDNAWASIKPATDVGGQIIGISTANGIGNWFHRFWVKAEKGQNSFVALFFPWDSVPGRTEEWYAEQVRDMEPHLLRQEYPTTAEEAFTASGNPAFDSEMLASRIEVLDPIFKGRLGKSEAGEIVPILDHGAEWLHLWEKPEPGMQYVIGADCSSGTPGGDYSTAHVIKANTHRVVARFQARQVPEDFAETLDTLGRYFNTAFMGPERNGHGLTVIRLLDHTLHYPNLYFHVQSNTMQTITKNPGWQTTAASKPTMVNDLGAALRRARLVLHCQETFTELLSFQETRKGNVTTYAGKPHDDLVDSLAIANQMLQFIHVGDHVPEDPKPAGLTFDFALSLIRNAPAVVDGSNTIGYKAPPPGDPLVYV